MMSNSPLASLAKQQGINFNPQGAQNLLKYVTNKPQGTGEESKDAAGDGEGNNGEVNVANFRSHK